MERVVRTWRRRAFPCVVLGILAIPLLAHVFLPQAAQSDNRRLAPTPGVPRNVSALMNWPHAVDAYLKDHFGFRAQLIDLYNAVNWRILGTSTDPRVIVGRNGRIFLSDRKVLNPFVLANCGAWWPEEARATFAADAAAAIRRLEVYFPQFSVFPSRRQISCTRPTCRSGFSGPARVRPRWPRIGCRVYPRTCEGS